MADKRNTIKIKSSLHEEMKKIVKLKGGGTTLTKEYELAINNHIKNFYQENAIDNSQIESIIDSKFKKMDRHLASMLGRSGMDISMILMGLILFLEHYFKTDRKVIMEQLRQYGAKYYVSASNKKEKEKVNNG